VTANHIHKGLGAAIKALLDVVAPSVDPDDPLAREQLQLVVDYLELVRSRTDLLWDRERLTLRHYLAMADAVGPSVSMRLDGAAAAGRRALGDADAGVRPLRDAAAELAGALSELVRALGEPDADPALCARVEVVVVDASQVLVDVERAWYLPLGFDPAPAEVGSVEAALQHATAELDRGPQPTLYQGEGPGTAPQAPR
jgi:hypothetical protein